MTGKYVAPALRGSQRQNHEPPIVEIAASDDPPSLLTAKEIYRHFNPSTEAMMLGGKDEGSKDSHTLHDASETPGKLAYVVVYANCVALWEYKTSALVKSNLELLPKSKKRATTATTAEAGSDEEEFEIIDGAIDQESEEQSSSIAVFKQVIKGERGFKLEGWFDIDHYTILEPKSVELRDMLQKKRTSVNANIRSNRNEICRWDEQLNRTWANVKLIRDKSKDHQTISISRTKHGVTDLLESMRRTQK